MELDELKASWQSLDRRVDELTAINRRLLTETISRKARWRLAPVLVGAVLNMIIGAWFALVWANSGARIWPLPPWRSRALRCIWRASASS